MPKETDSPFKLCQKKQAVPLSYAKRKRSFQQGFSDLDLGGWVKRCGANGLISKETSGQLCSQNVFLTPPSYKFICQSRLLKNDRPRFFVNSICVCYYTVIFLSGVWNKKSNTLCYNSVSMFKKLELINVNEN